MSGTTNMKISRDVNQQEQNIFRACDELESWFDDQGTEAQLKVIILKIAFANMKRQTLIQALSVADAESI